MAESRRYRITAVDHDPDDDFAVAEVGVYARIVAEHFAIRLTPTYHPCGVEGMMREQYTLDHMPSGYRCHVGTEDECDALARSLATSPANWSSSDLAIGSCPGGIDFFKAARAAAKKGEAIDFADFKGSC